MAKPALGRGLGALLGGTTPVAQPSAPAAPVTGTAPIIDTRERVERIALDRVYPSALQPRKDFPAEALKELADSIREQGILQPLIVRLRGEHYELIAGERRWRAAQMLGLSQVPAIVREADDSTVLELMLIENLQRENLNAIEEALGYAELIERFQLTQDQAAQRVGKSRTAVANALRLLKLSPQIQTHLRQGRLSVGHAKVILALTHAADQTLAADRVLRDGLSVRQTEALVARLAERRARAPHQAAGPGELRDAHVADLENRLQQRFATKVSLRYRQGKGAVEIRFFTDDDLERILEIAGVAVD
jgi:ParB family chromosome partitioning protein